MSTDTFETSSLNQQIQFTWIAAQDKKNISLVLKTSLFLFLLKISIFQNRYRQKLGKFFLFN